MQDFDGKNQRDQENKTWPACDEVELTLIEFWSDQLNRIKEYAESQPIGPGDRGE